MKTTFTAFKLLPCKSRFRSIFVVKVMSRKQGRHTFKISEGWEGGGGGGGEGF